MKKRELFILRDGLKAVGAYKGIKFAYAVVKNLRAVQSEIETIKATVVPSEAFQQYETARSEAVKKFAKKDDTGEPISELKGEIRIFPLADPPGFREAVAELREKHNGAVVEHEEKQKEYETFLDTDAEVELYKVKEEIVPKDITAEHLGGIFDIIEE